MTGAAIPPGVVADAAAAAKAWLRAANGDDETVIAALCVSAVLLAEAFCGRVLVARDWQETVAATGWWQRLAATPVIAVTAVAGPSGAVLPATAYAIDIDGEGTGWVRSVSRSAARMSVVYTAGEARGWADMPAPIAQGIAMLVAHLFDDRDAATAPPAAVAALWRPWRRLSLIAEQHA